MQQGIWIAWRVLEGGTTYQARAPEVGTRAMEMWVVMGLMMIGRTGDLTMMGSGCGFGIGGMVLFGFERASFIWGDV